MSCSCELVAVAKCWMRFSSALCAHSFDLCALDSNAQRDIYGQLPPHFTAWPTPGLWQVLMSLHNISPMIINLYVFPPIVLVGPLVRFLLDCAHINVTAVVFDVYPQQYWWPMLQARAIDPSVVLFPSPAGFADRPLQYDLWAFRCTW